MQSDNGYQNPNSQVTQWGPQSPKYRVSASDSNKIDAPWITIEFNDRPRGGEHFFYDGKEYTVMAVRVI